MTIGSAMQFLFAAAPALALTGLITFFAVTVSPWWLLGFIFVNELMPEVKRV